MGFRWQCFAGEQGGDDHTDRQGDAGNHEQLDVAQPQLEQEGHAVAARSQTDGEDKAQCSPDAWVLGCSHRFHRTLRGGGDHSEYKKAAQSCRDGDQPELMADGHHQHPNCPGGKDQQQADAAAQAADQNTTAASTDGKPQANDTEQLTGCGDLYAKIAMQVVAEEQGRRLHADRFAGVSQAKTQDQLALNSIEALRFCGRRQWFVGGAAGQRPGQQNGYRNNGGFIERTHLHVLMQNKGECEAHQQGKQACT